ncbi:MAG TPA: protein translocase subunit SecD [Oligoflexia bacterium]|nr:protein translocase subunit SecD [Oligoflexia bacterium]HMP26530.1 protein translocase subunit SecD [Oligoflexia bacterium]
MNDSLKRRVILLSVIIGFAILSLVPTVIFYGEIGSKEFAMQKWFTKPISLGLDLKGGAHLVYEVDTDEAIVSRLQSNLIAIKSYFKEEKIALQRSKVNEQGQIELVLFSEKSQATAEQLLETRFKELIFIERRNQDGKVVLLYGLPTGAAERIAVEAVKQSVATLRTRVDQFGVAEPIIQRVGEKRILLQMPGVSDAASLAALKKIIGSVAKLEFKLVPTTGGAEKNSGRQLVKGRSGEDRYVEQETLMGGDAVADARVSIHNGQIEVSLKLNSEGRRTFARITSEHIGRQLGIILDGVLYSAPVIREPIIGGEASISGGFAMDEAKQLAVILRAGALPAPLKIMEERTVGPTLGKESIYRGVMATLVGSLAIFLFMIIYYKKSGVIACFSLIVNILLVIAGLSLFGATLTLPGLAGLALTVGVAVDSNVIIYERIRDELRRGLSRDLAVAAGFERAFAAISDANLTSFIGALILYFLGTGPIRGFAVTLSIGILTTLFCALFFSRLLFDAFEIMTRDRKTLSI